MHETPKQNKKHDVKMNHEVCFYKVLGLEPTASMGEIRAAYKVLARTYHPDKRAMVESNPQQDADHSNILPPGVHSIEDMFSYLSQAYEILGDQTKRAEYDILHGFERKPDAEGLRHIKALQQNDAEKAVALMEHTFDLNRKYELSVNGLIIDDAWYGAIDDIAHIAKSDMEKPIARSSLVINVTRQLQCIVTNSKLLLPAGDSKSTLTGVYDPCPGEEKWILIRYYFRGKLHELCVEDHDKVLMPLKVHLVQMAAPPTLSSNKQKHENQSPSVAVAAASKKRRSLGHEKPNTTKLSSLSKFLFSSKAVPTFCILAVLATAAGGYEYATTHSIKSIPNFFQEFYGRTPTLSCSQIVDAYRLSMSAISYKIHSDNGNFYIME